MMGNALRSDINNLYRHDKIQSTNSESLEEEDSYEGKETCDFTGCLAMNFSSRSSTVHVLIRVKFTLMHEIRKISPDLSEFLYERKLHPMSLSTLARRPHSTPQSRNDSHPFSMACSSLEIHG